jgi:RimJ/RimL family protein N-acetyltransferase
MPRRSGDTARGASDDPRPARIPGPRPGSRLRHSALRAVALDRHRPAGPHLGGPFSRDDAFTEFAATCGLWLLRGHGLWTVELKAGGAVLGFVLIGFEPGDQEPELGYLFCPASEGQGFATEATMALRDHAFGALGMDRLVSYIAPENPRSARVAERLGAVRAADFDGAQVWVHRPVAPRTCHTHGHTLARHKADASQTSKRGD